MRAVVERLGLAGASMGFRWVESPTIYTGTDAEEYGPIALTNRGNAHVFASCEEAGRWADANSEHGEFVIHGARS